MNKIELLQDTIKSVSWEYKFFCWLYKKIGIKREPVPNYHSYIFKCRMEQVKLTHPLLPANEISKVVYEQSCEDGAMLKRIYHEEEIGFDEKLPVSKQNEKSLDYLLDYAKYLPF